jgi:hypothetical protein
MGAKYLPSVKDHKANIRFQRMQADKLKARKTAEGTAPAPLPVKPPGNTEPRR